MTRPAVVREAIALLRAKGVRLPKRDEAPLVHRMVWRCGIALAPPAYAGWFANLAILGVAFGLSWGVIVCVAMLWMDGALSLRMLIVVAMVAICMGLIQACRFRLLQCRIGLPTWEEFLRQYAGGAQEGEVPNGTG